MSMYIRGYMRSKLKGDRVAKFNAQHTFLNFKYVHFCNFFLVQGKPFPYVLGH